VLLRARLLAAIVVAGFAAGVAAEAQRPRIRLTGTIKKVRQDDTREGRDRVDLYVNVAFQELAKR
jgi:hypothetical protein